MFGQVPFYASPPRHKTSAEIISEARAAMQSSSAVHVGGAAPAPGGPSGPRAVRTRRPHTPRDPVRVLFGADARKDRPQRPPSSFNLGHLRFQTLESLDQQPSPPTPQVAGKGSHRLTPAPLPKVASLDEDLFSSVLTERDQKRSKQPKKPKAHALPCGSKVGLQAEVKQKLPTLSGLPKPLHKRQTLHSLHEEREDPQISERSPEARSHVKARPKTSPEAKGNHQRRRVGSTDEVYGLLSAKSTVRDQPGTPLSRRDFAQTTDPPARKESVVEEDITSFYIAARTTSEGHGGVARVFNRRRLFTDYKSTSADSGLGRLLPTDEQPDAACFEYSPSTHGSECQRDDTVPADQDSEYAKETRNRVTTKLAIEIPSPDVNENWLRNGRHPAPEQGPSKQDSRKILDTLAAMVEGEDRGDHERTVQLLRELYERLEEEGAFVQEGGRKKSAILKVLYNFVESTDDRILICIARILLAMRVTGSNLSAAFKLIFKVARNDKNDRLFLNDNIMELVVVSIGRTSPCDGPGAASGAGGYGAVYALGALRFLALGARTRAAAAAAGANHLMALQLKIVNMQKLETPRSVGDDVAHALYQLTGAMRNMAQYHDRSSGRAGKEVDAEEDPVFKDFLASGAVQELCSTIELFATDLDVVTNVARIFSVVSGRAPGREVLSSCVGWAGALQRALAAAPRRRQLVVRLAYALGNMAAHDDKARLQIFEEPGSMECLMDVIELYVRRCAEGRSGGVAPKTQRSNGHAEPNPDDPDNSIIGSDLAGSDGSDEDVLIKSIRVMANVCLHPLAGRGALAAGGGRGLLALLAAVRCAAHPPCDRLLFPKPPSDDARPIPNAVPTSQRSGEFTDLPFSSRTPENEKPSTLPPPAEEDSPLAATALAAISNLTYYIEDVDDDSKVRDMQIQLCKAMLDVLSSYGQWSWGTDCCVESLRVLGNASRWGAVRDHLVAEGGLQRLVAYLHSPVSEARRSAAGVLVNCAGGSPSGARAAGALARAALGAGGHRTTTAQVGRNAPPEPVDWRLRTLLAQAAWNAAEAQGAPPEDLDDFADALDEMLDEERIFGADYPQGEAPTGEGYDYEAWEEFASVAINILDRMCAPDHADLEDLQDIRGDGR